ncbi:MAG: YqiA/YcfP family alpha/beta fold hydrolase [Aliiglaciecola sp.]|uniref:YqiA/YcfP family alpha/beta fold hydrolase n=1 Tax=Aliiglaciecola sp. TaxID=1872441 RepID=UPI003299B67B
MEHVLIYIHGFMSSPQSVKAQQTITYVREYHPELTMEVPQVPNYPLEAAHMLESLVSKYAGKKLAFIGSSMGGFMSTHLVEKFGGKAVLINPAVRPFELLEGFLGTHINPYTNQEFTLQAAHIQQLIDLNTTNLNDPRVYWALLQTNDETLDYRQAEQKYANSRLTIEQGGDHSFQNYADHLPEIFKFLLS